ncbi:MAG: alpha/beta fold hydrolase [Acidobacteriota bacterium]
MDWQEFQSLQQVSELGNHFISYADEGGGDPVVLIHGIPTWGYLWEGVMQGLSKSRRVLVPDLLGFGYSDKSDRFDRSIDNQAKMLAAWMEKIGLALADFVGHDIGGGVALRLAVSFPEKVRSLCVMNTVCYDSWPVEMMLQLGHPSARRLMSASAYIAVLSKALRQGFASSPSKKFVQGLLTPYRTEVGKVSLIRNATALNTNLTTELTPRLSHIMAPTLILWGENDVFQLVKYGEWLARDIPEASLIRISKARHFVMVDQTDQVIDHLASFLTPRREPIAALPA